MKPLSKSEFVRGLDCKRRIWLDRNRPDLKPQLSLAVRDRVLNGSRVGQLARELYPHGVFVENPGGTYETGAEETLAMVEAGHPCLFEATFISGGRMARMDVLSRTASRGWTVDEVKSSTVKEPSDIDSDNIFDLAFQVLTAKQSGLVVDSARLVLVNSAYVWIGGEYVASEMLGTVDLTETCRALEQDVDVKARVLFEALGSDAEPDVETNTHCAKCDYFDHCFIGRPKHDLIYLPRISGDAVSKLRRKGYQSIDEIPESEKLTPARKRARDVIVNGQPFIGEGLVDALVEIPFPAAFVDYESSNPGFPSYPNTRPYQQICFQWSSHWLESPDSAPTHQEFLPENGVDPRAEFCRSLWSAVKDAKSLVHYTGFEIRELRPMVDAGIPYAAELLELITKRSVDLHKIIFEHVWFESFKGKTSIKVVLPTLVPSMSYEDLVIGDGAAAASGYRRMVDSATSDEERDELREALLTYCRQDTLAMVEIFRALRCLAKLD